MRQFTQRRCSKAQNHDERRSNAVQREALKSRLVDRWPQQALVHGSNCGRYLCPGPGGRRQARWTYGLQVPQRGSQRLSGARERVISHREPQKRDLVLLRAICFHHLSVGPEIQAPKLERSRESKLVLATLPGLPVRRRGSQVWRPDQLSPGGGRRRLSQLLTTITWQENGRRESWKERAGGWAELLRDSQTKRPQALSSDPIILQQIDQEPINCKKERQLRIWK